MQRLLYFFTGIVVLLALGSCVVLLVFDTPLQFLLKLSHAPVSAAPLLLIGLASLSFQLVVRPEPLELCKSLIVSAAFILWGIDQLLPPGWLATTMGDVVISLYVIDLGWVIVSQLRQGRANAAVRPETSRQWSSPKV